MTEQKTFQLEFCCKGTFALCFYPNPCYQSKGKIHTHYFNSTREKFHVFSVTIVIHMYNDLSLAPCQKVTSKHTCTLHTTQYITAMLKCPLLCYRAMYCIS